MQNFVWPNKKNVRILVFGLVVEKVFGADCETYKTKLDRVNELAISLAGFLWISDGNYKKRRRLFTSHTGLQKVKCEGNKLKVLSSFNTAIYDIAFTPDNDLLIADDESKLKQIKSGTNKIIDTVYDVKPFDPLSIYVTREKKIIVGTDGSTVVVMNYDGKHEKVYDKGQTKDTLFYPRKITATSNGNIFVADYTTQNARRVVVLGHKDIINTYSGHSDINTENSPFKPYDLATTLSDNVVVADGRNTLHILNFSGQLVTYINTEDKEIKFPYSIGLAMEGQSCMMYIGTPDKICKLNLIGC